MDALNVSEDTYMGTVNGFIQWTMVFDSTRIQIDPMDPLYMYLWCTGKFHWILQ